jgi:hypothetical protein
MTIYAILAATDESLEAFLGEAIDTNEVVYNIQWADSTSNGTAIAEDSTPSLSNGTTDTTIVAAPAADTKRLVVGGTVYNKDVIPHTITIQFDDNGTEYIMGKGILASGSSATLETFVTTTVNTEKVAGRINGFVVNPQLIYSSRPQVVMFRTPFALTITRIHIHCSDTSPTTELAGDLKWADDVNAGGFANAAVIDVCDTTNGVVTITSGFDDATVAAGKYVYFQMDSSPHADIKDFYIEVYYTVD